jgi:hypothetical protein
MVRSSDDVPSELMAQIITTESEPLRPVAQSAGDTEGGDVPQEPTVIARVAELSYQTASDEVATPTQVDLDKLSLAVGRHETNNCQLGYGKEYNNCTGVKNGSIAPCPQIGRNRMCIYDKPEDSYEAFKLIWGSPRGYKGMYPNLRAAEVYSGHDRARAWLNSVLTYMNE